MVKSSHCVKIVAATRNLRRVVLRPVFKESAPNSTMFVDTHAFDVAVDQGHVVLSDYSVLGASAKLLPSDLVGVASASTSFLPRYCSAMSHDIGSVGARVWLSPSERKLQLR